jgi:SHR-binding domain of vacuolar-sorting associated protein 13
VFSFGAITVAADPPFQRTKFVVVVDRFILVNAVKQPIEVRQCGCEDIVAVNAEAETPMWWRPGSQLVQVRLAKHGWCWSGRFSPRKIGEFPLRLRNEHDNSVFFIAVRVVKKGPRLCIVFRAGDNSAPYRIENHTMEVLRLRQTARPAEHKSASSAAAAYHTVLPYHACHYAWDEPLSKRAFTLEVKRRGGGPHIDHGMHGEWKVLGTYTFEQLDTFVSASKDHSYLLMKVVARGPVRIMEIYDTRMVTYEQTVASSALAPPVVASAKEIAVKGSRSPTSLGGLAPGQAKRTTTTAAATPAAAMLQVQLHVAAIGVSVIDHHPQELLFFSTTQIDLEHRLLKGAKRDEIHLSVGRMQVDSHHTRRCSTRSHRTPLERLSLRLISAEISAIRAPFMSRNWI